MSGGGKKEIPQEEQNPQRTRYDTMNEVREPKERMEKDGGQYSGPSTKGTSEGDRVVEEQPGIDLVMDAQQMEEPNNMENFNTEPNQLKNCSLQYRLSQNQAIDLNTLPNWDNHNPVQPLKSTGDNL